MVSHEEKRGELKLLFGGVNITLLVANKDRLTTLFSADCLFDAPEFQRMGPIWTKSVVETSPRTLLTTVDRTNVPINRRGGRIKKVGLD